MPLSLLDQTRASLFDRGATTDSVDALVRALCEWTQDDEIVFMRATYANRVLVVTRRSHYRCLRFVAIADEWFCYIDRVGIDADEAFEWISVKGG